MVRFTPFAQSLALLGASLLVLVAALLLPVPDVARLVLEYLVVVILLPAYAFSLAVWLLVARLRRRGIAPRVDDLEVRREEGLR